MSGPAVASGVRAAGDTDPGLQREVNEDRFHVDAARGLYMVIDGVGGQAAGGKAADTAVAMMRGRLERESGALTTRLREAITSANNEIHRLARQRPEWNGMACVLTAMVVRGDSAVVGHVGDTRLYKLRQNQIEKVTRDHSPVGEREDAQEISELEAMHHPRRNEVYRDVGSERHQPSDPDFIDVRQIAFEPDAALLLCSDGLTDLIDSSTINHLVRQYAGHPNQVVRSLIDAANDAGGKDNITVVYVEGEQFAAARREQPAPAAEITRRLSTASAPSPSSPPVPAPSRESRAERVAARASRRQRVVRVAIIALLVVVIVLTFDRTQPLMPTLSTPSEPPPVADTARIVVQPSQSIAQALKAAKPGTTIVVEAGEYRETLTLRSHVRLVSSVPRGAILRLPGAASEAAAAILAIGVKGAEVEGFRIVGDAATPLGTGVLAADSELSISQVEIAGANKVAVDVDRQSKVRVAGSDIRDNAGSGIAVRAGATAILSHNVFARNATAAGTRLLAVDDGGNVHAAANVFVGGTSNLLSGPSEARAAFARDNWFIDPPAQSRPPAARGSSGRRPGASR